MEADALYAEIISLEEKREKIATLSLLIPLEIIRAAGMIPYRIYGKCRAVSPDVMSIFSSNLCSYINSSFTEGIFEYKKKFSGVVIADTCDARKKLYEAWKYYYPDTNMYCLMSPKVCSHMNKEYFKHEILSFIEYLRKTYSRTITHDNLRESIEQYNHMRSLLGELTTLRQFHQNALAASKLHAIMKMSYNIDPEVFTKKLAEYISALKNTKKHDIGGKKRVLLCGSFFDHEAILDLIESFSGIIICQYNSLGFHYYSDTIDTTGDPINDITEYYFTKATKLSYFDTDTTIQEIDGLITKHNVDCVVYITLKFCDCNAITFCDIKEYLEKQSIPKLYLEMEHGNYNIENIHTRIETFMESIQGGKIGS